MITEKASKLKAEYTNLQRLGLADKDLVEESNEIWVELFKNCNPTINEFNEIAADILVTTDVFYYLMKAVGLWAE